MIIAAMDGFKKLELKKPNIPEREQREKPNSSRSFKIFGGLILGLIVLASILVFALVIPGKDLFVSIQNTSVLAKEAYTAVKNQDIESASNKLKEMEESFLEVERRLDRLTWLSFVPFLGSYVKDGEHLVKAGISGIQAAEIAAETVIPYADLLGLKGKSTFVAGTADERIKTAVETLDKVTPKLEEIAQKIAIAGEELDKVDPNRYPENIGKRKVRERLVTYKDLFTQTADLFVNAQPFFQKLPELLGNKEPKTYLVIFQNDAELRATGGFITAYALFKVDNGKIQAIKADDIYKLDAAKKKKFPAPDPILKYHKKVYNLELRDSNLSPDFAESMRSFEKMLEESVPDFPEFDGIIALDTHVLVSTIKVLGDFNVYGRVFSAENDSRCGCPKAIYELEDYATRPVAYVREDRKDIIGVLLYQMMQRALGISPSKYWGRLFQMFLQEARQKHVLFYFHDESAQKGIESINFAGRILPFDGDYLHINDVNFAGAKSNMFVKSFVKQDIKVKKDGSVVKTLVITYKNPAPPSNCNLEAGQLCLNGILRNWIRVYVPEGSKLIDFAGSEKDTTSYDELGKTVFEGFFTLKPQGKAEVKIQYILPFKVGKGKPYSLFIQKQPGTDRPEYIITKDRRKLQEFPLTTDKEISLKF